MTFEPPPPILQKVLSFKAIQHKDGKFLLWGIPCFVSELYAFLYLYKLIEDKYGYKEASSIFYSLGYLQGERGTSMLTKRFGYAVTIQDKTKLLKFNLGQAEIVGIGKFEYTRIDLKNNIFMIKANAPFAEEYKRFFGIQRNPVDHLIRGISSGAMKPIINKECFTVESRCAAMGKTYCEFITRPVDDWDKNDPLFKSQQIIKMKNMEELGAKIEPYIVSVEA